MSEQPTGAAFPVGARVRERDWPKGRLLPREGVVQSLLRGFDGELGVFVRWDDEAVGWYVVTELEPLTPPEPPRAPERVLVPGIVVSADTCDGKPVIQGTRLRCDSMYSYWLREVQEGHDPESALGRVATDYHTGMSSVRDAVVWQAAVRYTKERRKAKRKGGGAPT